MNAAAYIIMFLTLGAYLGGNIYMYVRFIQMMRRSPLWLKLIASLLFWILASAFFVSMAVRKTDDLQPLLVVLYLSGSAWLLFTLYMVMSLLVTDIARIWIPDLKYWGFLIAFALTCPLLIYGYFNYRNPDVNRLDVHIDKPMDGELKIVAVSDVHLGIGTGKKTFSRYVDMILAEDPDVILIAGDLIDNSIKPLYAQNMFEEFARLKAPMGVYMVPGNHEYISGIDECLEFLSQTDVTVLRDSVVTLPCGLQISGRDDSTYPDRKTIEQFFEKVDTLAPVLLLKHQPLHIEHYASCGVDIQISGHTHGGQIWPGNHVVDLLYEQADGWKMWGDTFVYVSSGLSLWGPPFRIGTDSDMAVLTVSGRD